MGTRLKGSGEEISLSALGVFRKDGRQGLCARALANELDFSVKPIFGLFKNM